jgi:hypothetical protein
MAPTTSSAVLKLTGTVGRGGVKQLGIGCAQQFWLVDDQRSTGADNHHQQAEQQRDPAVTRYEQRPQTA